MGFSLEERQVLLAMLVEPLDLAANLIWKKRSSLQQPLVRRSIRCARSAWCQSLPISDWRIFGRRCTATSRPSSLKLA